MRVDEVQQAWDVHHRHDFGPAAGDVDARFVGRYGNAEGLRRVAFHLVQRHFDWGGSAHIRAKQSDRVGEGSAVLQVR